MKRTVIMRSFNWILTLNLGKVVIMFCTVFSEQAKLRVCRLYGGHGCLPAPSCDAGTEGWVRVPPRCSILIVFTNQRCTNIPQGNSQQTKYKEAAAPDFSLGQGGSFDCRVQKNHLKGHSDYYCRGKQ